MWSVGALTLAVLEGHHSVGISAVDFSPDGRKLASVGLDHNAVSRDEVEAKAAAGARRPCVGAPAPWPASPSHKAARAGLTLRMDCRSLRAASIRSHAHTNLQAG